MNDVKCPNCGSGVDINHDDGYGYEDGGEYKQWCHNCRKYFNYVTSISYSYEVFCAEDHNLELDDFGWNNCTRCDYYERG